MARTDSRRRILFLIHSFEAGGTERQLVELLRGLDRRRFDATVASFYDGGAFADEVAGLDGIASRSLSKRGRWDVRFPFHLDRLLRDVRPHVLSSYLGVVNEIALVAGLVRRTPVVWNIRSSHRDVSREGWLPRASFRAGASMSRWPALTVFNSWAGLRFHERHGYRPRRAEVIPNGIDVERHRADPAAGARVREEWGVPAHARLVGLVGRLDPVKDHPTFLRACAELARTSPDLRAVCVGSGPSDTTALADLSAHLGLQSRVIWAGFRHDMTAVYNALDVSVSSSLSEGFSNVIAESMSCETPCVVTDVGDSRDIVGETGIVVPPGDPAALARGIAVQLAGAGEGLGAAARARICERFSRQQMVRRTEDLLDTL